MRGSHILPTSDELRMRAGVLGSEGQGAKVLLREGNNPDHHLRSPSVGSVEQRRSGCGDSQEVSLEAAIPLKSA